MGVEEKVIPRSAVYEVTRQLGSSFPIGDTAMRGLGSYVRLVTDAAPQAPAENHVKVHDGSEAGPYLEPVELRVYEAARNNTHN